MSNKQTEALKLALEALKKCDSALAEELAAWDIDPPLHHVLEASNACGPAITAIREALVDSALDRMAENARELGLDYEPAQQQGWKLVPVQPTDEMRDAGNAIIGDRGALFAAYRAMLNAAPQPAQQEPVAWYDAEKDCAYTLADCEGRAQDDLEPLYLAQSSKPWVGLTAEEIERVCVPLGAAMLSFTEVARAIEAKLREKNTGETK